MEPIRGVNLGGWLVLEPWLAPSLFTGTGVHDEYNYCRQAGAAAKKRLRDHRDTFVTEQDFIWLKNNHINAVRLPIGYWLFGDVEPYIGTRKYVDLAFAWAKKHDLKVMLDIHGVAGSQNGKVHSGRIGPIDWHLKQEHIVRTLAFVERLVARYGKHSALLGISLLNEPSPNISSDITQAYYKQAYSLIREALPSDTWTIFSDGFKPRRWRHRLSRQEYPGLYIDHHQYQIYMRLDKLLSAPLQVWRAKNLLPRKLRRINKHHPVIIGEWSVAMRSSKVQKYTQKERELLAYRYAEAQLRALNTCAAWFYWNYKTQGGGVWSYRDLIDRGVIPSN